MLIVGLTGGIASGKSYVANYLKKIKIPIHESDKVVRLLYKSPTVVFLDYLNKNGFKHAVLKKKIDKKIIIKEIFNNKTKKEKLELFVHKVVRKNRKIFLKKKKNEKIVFLDIPLLFEKKLENTCQFICTTISPLYKRKKRALQRPGMNKKFFNQIIKNQVKDSFRKKKSHFLIKTSETKRKTCLQVDKIIYDVLNKKK